MEYAKIFTNGGSQAVRLPKDCRFEESQVLVRRIGDYVILMPEKADPWDSMRDGLAMLTDDFLAKEIEDLPVQERENL